jgi:hypothetical protein
MGRGKPTCCRMARTGQRAGIVGRRPTPQELFHCDVDYTSTLHCAINRRVGVDVHASLPLLPAP